VDAASGLEEIPAASGINGTALPSESLDPQDAGRGDSRWGNDAG
jgi:hypothetical protein